MTLLYYSAVLQPIPRSIVYIQIFLRAILGSLLLGQLHTVEKLLKKIELELFENNSVEVLGI